MSEDTSTSDLILRTMQDRSEPEKIKILSAALDKLHPNEIEDWLAVSNLNHTQIMEISKIMLIKEMMLPDTCDWLTSFVGRYIRLNVSKNAHGRHDIRDMFSGLTHAEQSEQGKLDKLKGVVSK
ncbi:hypothetical protein EFE42_01180 [Methanohalophilus sp. RSK]|uniref:hypothetical protein n=1 Tax=Methanohalophilus sp. RSK TaxID=2485783 RepID=UPI000F43D291|nr:hypothetical protein [Methanohalophilus sp. RSK]RNI15880.1 hypothetical protein EFE42_01180 [Methanohalophilus sp. RSK]